MKPSADTVSTLDLLYDIEPQRSTRPLANMDLLRRRSTRPGNNHPVWQVEAGWATKATVRRADNGLERIAPLDWVEYAEWAQMHHTPAESKQESLAKVYRAHPDVNWLHTRGGRPVFEGLAAGHWRRLSLKLQRTFRVPHYLKELKNPRDSSDEVDWEWEMEAIKTWTRQACLDDADPSIVRTAYSDSQETERYLSLLEHRVWQENRLARASALAAETKLAQSQEARAAARIVAKVRASCGATGSTV